MTSHPTVIVWAHSPRWCSAISRQLGQFQLSWVLDYDSLCEETLKIAASAVVIEIPNKSLDCFPAKIAQLANNSFQIKTFTIGKLPNPSWERELRLLGNCGHFQTLIGFSSLESAIRRHHQHRFNGKKSIEENVRSNLPWPTR